MKNRKGKFKITNELLSEHEDIVLKLLADVIVVRAEHQYMTDLVEYHGLSKLFDEVKTGEIIPHYKLEIVDDNVIAVR